MTGLKCISAALLGLLPVAAGAYEPAGTPPDWDPPMGEPMKFSKVLVDRFEAGVADEADTYLWDVQAWYGGDRNRLWFKTEGEGEWGESAEQGELQLLFGRLLAPYWDWQIGVRHDLHPEPQRTHLALGLQGVAPYEFEFDSALFVDDRGNPSARLEAEYELNLTQRWVLQPRFEINVGFSSDRAIGEGSGLRDTELGLRLRYEFRREVAPYLGVSWQQLYGDTENDARAAREPTSVTSVVAGIRLWF